MWGGPVSMLRSVSSTLPTIFSSFHFFLPAAFYFLNSSTFSFCMKGIWMYCEIWNCKIFSWQMFSNVFQRKKWIHCCIKTFEKGKDVWNSPRKSWLGGKVQSSRDSQTGSAVSSYFLASRNIHWDSILKKKPQRKLTCKVQIPEMIPNGSYLVFRTKTVCV